MSDNASNRSDLVARGLHAWRAREGRGCPHFAETAATDLACDQCRMEDVVRVLVPEATQ